MCAEAVLLAAGVEPVWEAEFVVWEADTADVVPEPVTAALNGKF